MKKNEQEKWESKLSRRNKWNRWKGVIVTTFSIVFGTFTNLLFTLYPVEKIGTYIGWILLAVLVIVCAAAIIIDSIWDNRNKKLKLDYDVKYNWKLNPNLTSCIQKNLSDCLNDYQFCDNHSDLEKVINVYYNNMRRTLNNCCEVFSSIFSEADEEKMTFSIRYMFKSKIDNKVTILWGKNSAPEHIQKRILNSDCYERTGAADMIEKGEKQPKPIPCTKDLDEKDLYYENENSSKLLVPVQSHMSSMIVGVIVIKKKLTSNTPIFNNANRQQFSWQYALQHFTDIIAMIEKQFYIDINHATKEQLKEAYDKFFEKTDLHNYCKDSIII